MENTFSDSHRVEIILYQTLPTQLGGCLISQLKRSPRFAGLITGDALCAPFEFKNDGTYAKRYPSTELDDVGEIFVA